ncbi:LysR family transcriptional regulator [Kutzneria sp. NPDC052558]|uniref:LysR family transcriptional regulator n=1 Tax=Kutzneria sp. NPDC052558 TaxID=3364121 RepID=UPI0037C65B3A
METLHLRYFVAVAEELNFSAAARRLHMAASPLSQRIRDFERELGLRLFERDTRRVALTPAGAALLPIARDILEQFNSIPWRLREATRDDRTRLLIGMPAGLHPTLRSAVGTLRGRVDEQIELHRWPGKTQALITGVSEGKLALALARMPFSDPRLGQLPVLSEPMGAAVPADRFAGRDRIALAELADLAYVPPPRYIRSAYFDVLESELAERGIRNRLTIADTGYEGVAEVISSGLAFCVSILDPASPIHGHQLDNVAVLPFTDFGPRLDTALIWRRDRAEGGDLTELVRVACEVFVGSRSPETDNTPV